MPSTTWTVAAMFAHSSGLPLVLPGGANSEVAQDVFLPEVQTIGDVLEDAGYRQTLLIRIRRHIRKPQTALYGARQF